MPSIDPLPAAAIGLVVGLAFAIVIGHRYRSKLRVLRAEMEDLETQARNARSTRDAVGEVIGSMTQRVVGPIQNIVGFGRVLEQSANTTDVQRDIARAVGDSGRQLEQILGDALGVSLSTTGSLGVEESEVDIADLMASVARSVRSRCIRAQLKFALLLGPDLPKTVKTDAVKLRYVLQNMINEVISTTDAGGHVTLAAARWLTPTPGTHEVRLSFEACGGDSPPALQPGSPKTRRLAEAVEQSVDERSADQLTLAEQFARVLGGTIVAIEGPNGGINLHAEVTVWTEEPALAEVIELDGFQAVPLDPADAGFFGGPKTDAERLVEAAILDQRQA